MSDASWQFAASNGWFADRILPQATTVVDPSNNVARDSEFELGDM
jgi:hypothetical protein